jgi:hypothetical protein
MWTFDQILLPFQVFGSEICCLVSVGRPLWREARSVLYKSQSKSFVCVYIYYLHFCLSQTSHKEVLSLFSESTSQLPPIQSPWGGPALVSIGWHSAIRQGVTNGTTVAPGVSGSSGTTRTRNKRESSCVERLRFPASPLVPPTTRALTSRHGHQDGSARSQASRRSRSGGLTALFPGRYSGQYSGERIRITTNFRCVTCVILQSFVFLHLFEFYQNNTPYIIFFSPPSFIVTSRYRLTYSFIL